MNIKSECIFCGSIDQTKQKSYIYAFCIEILQEMEVINKSTLVWLKKYNNHPLITQKRNGILITRIENLLR